MSGLRIGLAVVGAIVAWFLAFTFEADAGWTAGLAAAGAVIGWLLGGVRPGPGPGGLEPGAGAEG